MQLAGEQIAVLRGVAGLTAVRAVDEEEAAAAAQLCLQGPERQLTHCHLTRRKYTVRLTKMPSNNTKALQRDEEVSIKAKNRLLTRSRGLL
jgi:transketolase